MDGILLCVIKIEVLVLSMDCWCYFQFQFLQANSNCFIYGKLSDYNLLINLLTLANVIYIVNLFIRQLEEQRSPISLYFLLNSPYRCGSNQSVVDSDHCTWLNCKHAIVLRVCWNPILSSQWMLHKVTTVSYHLWWLWPAVRKETRDDRYFGQILNRSLILKLE